MESEKIYQLGKLLLEKDSKNDITQAAPSNVHFVHDSTIDPEFMLSLPCHVLSIARYEFEAGFSLRTAASDVYALLYVYAGALSLQSRNRAVSVEAGHAVFLQANGETEVVQEAGKLDILLLRTIGCASGLYHRLLTSGEPEPIAIRKKEELENLFAAIQYYMQNPTRLNTILLANTMSGVFTALCLEKFGETGRDGVRSQPKWFTDTVAFFQENYAGDTTMREVVEHLSISESQFYKRFKDYTGESPYQYLVRIRLNHAEQMLTATQFQVKFIAAAVGFDSVNHFIRHFKKKTGLTPLEYRRRQRHA